MFSVAVLLKYMAYQADTDATDYQRGVPKSKYTSRVVHFLEHHQQTEEVNTGSYHNMGKPNCRAQRSVIVSDTVCLAYIAQ